MARDTAPNARIRDQAEGGTATAEEQETDPMDGDRPRPVIIRIETIPCIRHCGWFRAYTKIAEWENRLVAHPLYGLLKQHELVRLDVQTHDCTEYRNSLVRMWRARNERTKSVA